MLRILQTDVIKLLEDKLCLLSIQTLSIQQERSINTRLPKLRNPTWFVRKERKTNEEFLTTSNREFVKDIVKDKFIKEAEASKELVKPSTIEWTPNLKRTGIIARKIGQIPMWLSSGKKIHTTLLQVLDNHVIKYYPPEEYDPPRKRHTRVKNKHGCLLLGAESTDPTVFTKEYCGIFKNSGVLPKKFLARFFVSPNAALNPGTPLSALHFTVGNYVDVRGKTVDRGFQGVMKRHGFKGMPAAHGTTKTHRRGGCIGGGGEKGRVWPGTKMPGHMGNRYRVAKGLKIWRINTKYNVLFVSGCGVPGETNSIVYIHDTLLPLRKPKHPIAFPTYFETENKQLEEDIFDESLHKFSDPTIIYEES